MMFFFPFGFLLAIVGIFIAVRFGLRLFHNFFRGIDQGGSEERRLPGERSWLPPEWRSLGNRPVQNLQAKVFRIAYRRKGRITVSDVVIETSLGLKEAEELLNGMVDGLRVRMEVDPKNGMVFYEFPEIISRFEKP
jgi:hypothetical protein